MKSITFDQIKAFMQSISGIVHKQADTLDRTTATANEAHETALYSRKRIDGKMDAVNPTGTGVVSFGRYMEDTETYPIGKNSIAIGERSFATSEGSVAIGDGAFSNADHSCAIGNNAKTDGVYSVAIGLNAKTGGYTGNAVAIGSGALAEGDSSFAIGTNAKAQSKDQIVMGILNKYDSTEEYYKRGKYLYILGNGDFKTGNSNAMTIDWNGNAWFQGDVYVGGAGQEDKNASKLIAQKDIGDGLEVVDGKLNAFYRKVELINSFTVTEDVDSLAIDKDADGNPFELKVAIMRIQCGMDVAEGEATGSIMFSTPTNSNFARIYLNRWKYPGYKVTDTYARPSAAAALCDVSRDFTFLDGICGDEGGAVNDRYSFSKDSLAYAPDTVIVRAGTNFKIPKNAKVWLYGVRRIGV